MKNFDYEWANNMLNNLSVNEHAINYVKGKGMQPAYQNVLPTMNPNMMDVFGDYFDDGLVRGQMQPVGFFQRQNNIDSMEFSPYQKSLM